MKFFIAWVAAVATACGGSGGSGGDDEVAIGDFSSAYLDALCGAMAECGTAPSVATCKANVGATTFAIATVVADVASGVVIYDGAAAKACIDSLAHDCKYQGPHAPAPEDDPCRQMLTGTVATGGACFYYEECTGFATCTPTDASCDPSKACCAGTCGAPVAAKAKVGETCKANVDCVEDAFCAGGTCKAAATHAGDPCTNDYGCANPMLCDSTCYLPAATGETCDPTVGAEVACADERDYCAPGPHVCVPRVVAGGMCSSSVLCEGTASCSRYGMCMAAGKLGDTCDNQQGLVCQYGLTCYAAQCVAAPAAHACQ